MKEDTQTAGCGQCKGLVTLIQPGYVAEGVALSGTADRVWDVSCEVRSLQCRVGEEQRMRVFLSYCGATEVLWRPVSNCE